MSRVLPPADLERLDQPWPIAHPLTDDGDALRLAVMLRLDVSINRDIQVAWWHGDSLEFVTESLGNDHLAAVRRAMDGLLRSYDDDRARALDAADSDEELDRLRGACGRAL